LIRQKPELAVQDLQGKLALFKARTTKNPDKYTPKLINCVETAIDHFKNLEPLPELKWS
jgi:hypothetical protein